MTQQYLAEIRMMSFPFAPKGWAFCNGQLLPIQQNAALFSLLGTTYGGDGIRTFGLPNLQGRVPLSYGTAPNGTSYALGQIGGEISHTLLLPELPQHNHIMQAKAVNGIDGGAAPAPTELLAQGVLFTGTSAGGTASIYSAPPAGQPMAATVIGNEGGSQPHANQQPYQVLNFCIALTGIYPSRS